MRSAVLYLHDTLQVSFKKAWYSDSQASSCAVVCGTKQVTARSSVSRPGSLDAADAAPLHWAVVGRPP